MPNDQSPSSKQTHLKAAKQARYDAKQNRSLSIAGKKAEQRRIQNEKLVVMSEHDILLALTEKKVPKKKLSKREKIERRILAANEKRIQKKKLFRKNKEKLIDRAKQIALEQTTTLEPIPNILRDGSRANLPRTTDKHYRNTPISSPPISAATAITIGVANIIAGVVGKPPAQSGSKGFGAATKYMPFNGDFSDKNGIPVMQNVPKLGNLIEMVTTDPAKLVFQLVDTPASNHLSQCETLVEKPTQTNKIDIFCVRPRELSIEGSVPVAVDFAFSNFAAKNITGFLEVLDGFSLAFRQFITPEIKREVIKKIPERLDEFEKYAVEQVTNLEYEWQKKPHRLDLIYQNCTGDRTSFIPNTQGEQFKINFDPANAQIRALQKELVVSFLNAKKDKVEKLLSLEVKFPTFQVGEFARNILSFTSDKPGFEEVFELALEAGVNPNGDNSRDAPLFITAIMNDVPLMRLLVKYKADIYKAFPSGANVFGAALISGHVEPLEFLIDENQYDMNRPQFNLHKTIEQADGKITAKQYEYLLKSGLATSKTWDGFDLLEFVIARGYANAMKNIIDTGKHLTYFMRIDAKGTRLHSVIEHYGNNFPGGVLGALAQVRELTIRKEMIQKLLDEGVNPYIRDQDGKTAKDLAEEKNLHELAALLDAHMQKDKIRYAEYIANKKSFWSIEWFQVLSVIGVFIISFALYYINLVLPRRWRIQENAGVQRENQAERERKSIEENRVREETRKKEQEEKRFKEIVDREKVEKQRQDNEAKTLAEEANNKLRSKYDGIVSATKAYQRQIDDLKLKQANLNNQKTALLNANLMKDVNTIKDSPRDGEAKRLANRIADKNNTELMPLFTRFATLVADYDTTKAEYDTKNKPCQDSRTESNVNTLDESSKQLQKFVEELLAIEKNIISVIQKVREEIPDFNGAYYRELKAQNHAHPLAPTPTPQNTFRFKPGTQNTPLPAPKNPSSSRRSEEVKIKVAPPEPAPPKSAAPALKLERKPRKPAAAESPTEKSSAPSQLIPEPQPSILRKRAAATADVPTATPKPPAIHSVPIPVVVAKPKEKKTAQSIKLQSNCSPSSLAALIQIPPPPAAAEKPAANVATMNQTKRIKELFEAIEKLGQKALDALYAGAPLKLECPISTVLMKDPVLATDGYLYDRISIEEWINRPRAPDEKIISPMDNNLALEKTLTPSKEKCLDIIEFLENFIKTQEKNNTPNSLMRATFK